MPKFSHNCGEKLGSKLVGRPGYKVMHIHFWLNCSSLMFDYVCIILYIPMNSTIIVVHVCRFVWCTWCRHLLGALRLGLG